MRKPRFVPNKFMDGVDAPLYQIGVNLGERHPRMLSLSLHRHININRPSETWGRLEVVQPVIDWLNDEVKRGTITLEMCR